MVKRLLKVSPCTGSEEQGRLNDHHDFGAQNSPQNALKQYMSQFRAGLSAPTRTGAPWRQRFCLPLNILLLLLLLLSCFNHVWLRATPSMAANQAPPSLGFSREQYWGGLPFPPMHESEKWKWSHSVMSDSYWPHGLQPIRLLCPWDFPGKITGVGCHCLLLGWQLIQSMSSTYRHQIHE